MKNKEETMIIPQKKRRMKEMVTVIGIMTTGEMVMVEIVNV